MASDEDEELAALRASRKDRLGAAGLTRVRWFMCTMHYMEHVFGII